MELARLLVNHPVIRLRQACSRAEAGRKLGDVYPFLADLPGSDVVISVYSAESVAAECELVFLAVPAGAALRMAPELLSKNVKVIDFSADFRLRDPAVYSEWYGQDHTAPELLESAIYGLPELNEASIRKAVLVANPGCYPTASILGLAAALKQNMVDPDSIIIDAASGASGAGRKAVVANLYCEISDNFRAYSVPRHRHTPEIEQEIGKLAGASIRLTFTPHILPMKRGILATIYASLRDASIQLETVREAYKQFWANKKWIRIHSGIDLPETAHVRGSMFCDISVQKDERTGRLIILSAIDNLCRGASGQALANANLMCGLPLDCGMENLAPLP